MRSLTLKHFVIGLFSTIIITQSIAQEKIKFGKVSMEDLQMSVYEKDTSAEAVVLFNRGVLSSRTLEFRRHLRVKILKKSGYERANLLVQVPSKSSVRGYTFNIEGGEIIKTKLSKESIFQEELVEDYNVLRVFMPNVKEGSVIEIEYTHFLPPFEWKFQDEIPVVYSELWLQQNTMIDFAKNMFGFVPLTHVSNDRWVAQDMPAMRPEPFTNSINNYISKMEIEIRSINIPGAMYKDFASDWISVYKILAESSRFGQQLAKGGYLKKEAEQIMSMYSTPEERLMEAHSFIKEHIKWNGDERLYTSNELPIVYKKEKIGNSADVNLSLIALLQRMDINAQPVVLSTVENGVLSLASPSISKLNYVVGYVKLGEEGYFLDATDPNLPVGMLPERCLNGQGRLMSPNANKWITLKPSSCYDKEVVQLDLKVNQDGSISGKISCKMIDYAALHFREAMEEYNEEEDYIEALETRYNGLVVNDHTMKNIDEDLSEPVYGEFEIDMTDMSDDLGGTIALSPLFFNVPEENPFKSATREYPIHFLQPRLKSSVVKIELPDGYTFAELPKPMSVRLPENAGAFIYSVGKVNDKLVQIHYKMDISKTVFLPNQYPYLQKLYSIVLDHITQQVLIKKTT